MPELTERQRKIKKYQTEALAYTKKIKATDPNTTFPTIKPGSAEWDAWKQYFNEHCGFRPVMMDAIEAGKYEVLTVPAQWPEWFDSSFSAVDRKQIGGHDMLKTLALSAIFLLACTFPTSAMAKRSTLDCLPGQGNLQTVWNADGSARVSCEVKAKVGKIRARKVRAS